MKTFIIDGDRTDLEIRTMEVEAILLESTTTSDQWAQFIHSGIKILKLYGYTADGVEVSGTYQILKIHNGLFHLKKLMDNQD